jgi:hypothetical protein
VGAARVREKETARKIRFELFIFDKQQVVKETCVRISPEKKTPILV